MHDWIDQAPDGRALGLGQVLGEEGVVQAFQQLRSQGKVRHFGFTALGNPTALSALVASGAFDTAQVHYHILNQSAVTPLPPGSQQRDLGQVLPAARAGGLGIIVIRPLAAGALTDQLDRDPVSGDTTLLDDLARASRLSFLRHGQVKTLSQAAILFILARTDISVVIPGAKNPAEIEEAAACSGAPGLPPEDLQEIERLYAGDFVLPGA